MLFVYTIPTQDLRLGLSIKYVSDVVYEVILDVRFKNELVYDHCILTSVYFLQNRS
jgi:hypothetical protein